MFATCDILRRRPPSGSEKSPLRRTFPRRHRGFTLVEASITTVIIGIGVVAMLQLLAAGTISNVAGTELTTAVNLANNIHEIANGLPFYDPTTGASTNWSTKESGGLANYDDVLDLDGESFSPPVDVRRSSMSDYAGWKQDVQVQTVGQNLIGTVVPDTTTEPTARITVTISRHGRPVYETSWIVVASDTSDD